ncbi:hypothetical protein [Lysobacter gummosus]|uniref:hypothetical protein n=1 Tax=Lysobacter gummosus TaxID=262324 RepID=UPI00362D45CB
MSTESLSIEDSKCKAFLESIYWASTICTTIAVDTFAAFDSTLRDWQILCRRV